MLLFAVLTGTSLTAGAANTAASPATASIEAEIQEPDAAGTLSFQNLETRIRTGNYSFLACAESIASIEAMDRKAAYDDVVAANNALADMIFMLAGTGMTMQLEQQQEALRKQIDSLKPEEYEKTYQENIRQINAVADQIIMGTQTLYITVLGLERQLEEGNRGLAALGRTVTEMELRYKLGQVSELSLLELKKTYSSTQSQLNSLSTQIRNLKSQLQAMVGEEPTGELTLLPLPEVTEEMIASMDYDAGLEAALASNMDIYWKNEDVKDAKEDWDDASWGYPKKMAEHTYRSKVYTYEATKQSVMFSYGNLYRAVLDNRQILEAAQVSLSFEQKNCEAMKKKFELGIISENAWKNTQDALASAEYAVIKAKSDLFSSYLSYQWATRGIIAG